MIPRSVAMAVALAATVLTHEASAQQDVPRDTSSADTGPTTPLALRPSKPLELSREPEHTSLGWQVVAVVAIIGGAAFYLKKRVLPPRPEVGGLTIVRRASIGLRSELLVVNVEGQRLLLGVTPHSIQSLAVLDGEEAAAPTTGDGSDPVPSALGDRFAAMLKAAEPRDDGRAGGQARRPESAHEAARPTAELRGEFPESAREAALAGQARGLAGLRRRG